MPSGSEGCRQQMCNHSLSPRRFAGVLTTVIYRSEQEASVLEHASALNLPTDSKWIRFDSRLPIEDTDLQLENAMQAAFTYRVG